MNQNKLNISVKVHKAAVSTMETAYVRTQLGRALKQFQPHVRNLTVWLTDLNGPRGGDSDLECRVVIDGDFPTVVVTERAATVAAAIDLASDRVSQTIARHLGRMRTLARRAS
jgi:ribosome-associated translation inhibitor RaiA